MQLLHIPPIGSIPCLEVCKQTGIKQCQEQRVATVTLALTLLCYLYDYTVRGKILEWEKNCEQNAICQKPPNTSFYNQLQFIHAAHSPIFYPYKIFLHMVYVIYVTWAGRICLICTHKPEGECRHRQILTTHVTYVM